MKSMPFSTPEDRTLNVLNLEKEIISSFTGDNSFKLAKFHQIVSPDLETIITGDSLGKIHFLSLVLQIIQN